MGKEEARRLIAEGNTREVTELLIEEIDKIGKTELTATQIEIICISGRFQRAEAYFLKKLIKYEEFDLISNKVNLSLLELIELID